MRHKILAFILTIFTIGGFFSIVTPAPALAAVPGGNCGAPTFLGFRPWYQDLCEGGAGTDVKQPANQDDTVDFIWTIILNILFDLFLAVGYLALGFVVYGGFLYIMAQGDPGRAVKGQRTLTSAIIGTVIAMVATVIVNTVKVVLNITDSNWNQGGDFGHTQLENMFNWIYTVAGLVAVVFIIKAGIEYLISRGDTGKTQKAMRSIVYALVGLVIVLLAAAITAFVMRATGGSIDQSRVEAPQIRMEGQHEKVLG